MAKCKVVISVPLFSLSNSPIAADTTVTSRKTVRQMGDGRNRSCTRIEPLREMDKTLSMRPMLLLQLLIVTQL